MSSNDWFPVYLPRCDHCSAGSHETRLYERAEKKMDGGPDRLCMPCLRKWLVKQGGEAAQGKDPEAGSTEAVGG